MKTTHYAWRGKRWAAGAIVAVLAGAVPARAGAPIDRDSDEGRTTAERGWTYDTRGPNRSAANQRGGQWWENGPWFVALGAGPAWFGGDDLGDSVSFAAQARVGREITDEVYVVGSYLLAFPETDVTDPASGSTADDRHDLHAVTFGVGFQGEVTPEVRLFVEPRAGVAFGSDIDAAPVGAVTAGVALYPTEGIAVRFEVTGLVTDADVDTDAGDAKVKTGVVGTFGVSFEF
jgi:hypothetical protein